MAYAVSDGGTDWDTWRVREVESGRDLPDLIGDTKFTGVSWLPDASAFYYSRYPKGADGKGDDQQQVSVYRHVLGTAQADDVLVYALPENPRHNPYGIVTEDGRWLVLVVTYGFDSNAIHLRDLSKPDAPVVRLLDKWDGIYDFLGAMDGKLYFRTTQGAPRGRVIAIDPAIAGRRPRSCRRRSRRCTRRAWSGGHVIASYLEDARTRVVVYGKDGKRLHDLRLPGLGTAIGFPDSRRAERDFLRLHGLPDAARALSLRHRGRTTVTPFRKPTVAFDPAPYVTEQVFYDEQGRHARADVHHAPQGREARRREPDAALRLRRVRRLADADLQRRRRGLARAGRRLRGREPARRRRVRRGLARRRHEGEEAERVRRLHRRGRVADREGLHLAAEARDPRAQQRRAPGRRGAWRSGRSSSARRCRASA